MGNKASLKNKAVKYFKDLQSSTTIINDNNLKELVQLSFSLEQCSKGSTYYFFGHFYENGVKKPIEESEKLKPDSNCLVTFPVSFVITYLFETQQPIELTIYKDNIAIKFDCSLGSIVGSKNNTLVKPLGNGTDTIRINAKELKTENKQKLRICFTMEKGVDYKRFRHKFYYILAGENNLYQSELLQDSGVLNDVIIPISLISPQFTIQFYDQYKKLAQTNTFTPESIKNDENAIIPVVLGSNTVKIRNHSQNSTPVTFIDYLRGGTQIALSIGIDFTGSNGSPSSSTSNHYNGVPALNNYEMAIRQCGDILSDYDSDKVFPVYGFGADVNGRTSMCFPITLNNNPNIETIDNVLKEYRNCLTQISFSGPTVFAPLINTFLSTVNKNDNTYHVLMIMTDGMIDDMQDTTDAIIKCTLLPISIVIIGIGNANFSSMNQLDGDENLLKDRNGKVCNRDIVQFVPFNQYKDNPQGLAAAVLEEIPSQLLEYYQRNNILPALVN